MDTKLLILLILVPQLVASEFRITVNVKELIHIHTNVEFLNSPIPRLEVTLENWGSVGCDARIRLDVYRKGERVFTSWSRRVELWPGAAENVLSYVPLFNQTGVVRVRLYHCNEIQEIGNFSFNSTGFAPERGKIRIGGLKNFGDEVEITGEANVSSLVVVPMDYPTGWVFEYGVSEVEDGEFRVTIRYEPTVWKQSNVTFIAISQDGKFYDEKTFELREPGWLELLIKFLRRVLNLYFVDDKIL